MAESNELTPKQDAFCREYLIDLNATAAAIRAGYSEKTADQQGSRLLTNVKVKKVIAELSQERSERTQINADYVLKRLTEIDQMDVADILDDDGDLKPIKQWPKCWRTTLSGLDIMAINSDGDVSSVLKKIKWPDKVKNLELLGKHIQVQAFKEQTEISGGISVEPKGLDDFYSKGGE